MTIYSPLLTKEQIEKSEPILENSSITFGPILHSSKFGFELEFKFVDTANEFLKIKKLCDEIKGIK